MNSFDLLFSHLEYNVLCRLWVERHDEACVERASDQVWEYRSSQCLFGFGLGLPEMSRFTKVFWKSFLGTIWYFFASQCQALDEVSHIENTNLKNKCLHSLLLSWCKREGRKETTTAHTHCGFWSKLQHQLCHPDDSYSETLFETREQALETSSSCSLWVLKQIAASALPSRWLLCWTYLRPESKLYCKNLVLITEGKIHAYPNSNSFKMCILLMSISTQVDSIKTNSFLFRSHVLLACYVAVISV
jgi:hypothetical protein